MDYQGIFDRIRNNLDFTTEPSNFRSICKLDIFDSIVKITRKSFAEKKLVEYAIYEGSAPSKPTLTEGGAGNVDIGVHKVMLVYLTERNETDPSDEVSITISGSSAFVSISDIPTRPHGVTAVRIYATRAGGDTFYLLASITDDSTTYIYNTSDESLRYNDEYNSSNATATGALSMPSDFYIPLEVKILTSSGNIYASKEMSYEDYMNWNPNTDFLSTSFSEAASATDPVEYYFTDENDKYDGNVGYCFPVLLVNNLRTMVWKPDVNCTIQIYYVAITQSTVSTLTNSPSVHFAFHELIVLSVTLKWLKRRMLKSKTEVELFACKSLIQSYEEQYKEMLNDYAGYVETTAYAQTAEIFNFLNDRDMLIEV